MNHLYNIHGPLNQINWPFSGSLSRLRTWAYTILWEFLMPLIFSGDIETFMELSSYDVFPSNDKSWKDHKDDILSDIN